MADLLFPPHACVSAQRVDTLSNTASSRSVFTGATRTVDRGGDRFRWSITRSNASDRDGYAERSILQAFRAQVRGQANRVWFADPGYVQRGSFPSQELLTNNTFENGASGWTSNSEWSISAPDRMLRSRRVNIPSGASQILTASASVTLAQYAPYVMRYMIQQGRGSFSTGHAAGYSGVVTFSPSSTSFGLRSFAATRAETSVTPAIVCLDSSGQITDDFVLIPYVSLSRCALIDNGGNLFTRSDEFDHADWTPSAVTVTANAGQAPDGTTTMDQLLETTANSIHFIQRTADVTVSSSASDFSYTVVVDRINRQYCYLQIDESLGGTSIYQVFDIVNGTAVSNSGPTANLTNLRAHIRNLGGSKFAITLTFRKTNAATGISALVGPTSGDNRDAYVGNTSNGIYVWRASLTSSNVPTRLVQTTTAASSGQYQAGIAIHIKGLPINSAGLLLPGDRVQIENQLCEVVAPLNSDAAGLGYLQLAWPLRSEPANNAPVIINNPMARCILTSNEGGWSDTPGGFSEFDFQIEESLDG